jgi:hypothetical protein
MLSQIWDSSVLTLFIDRNEVLYAFDRYTRHGLTEITSLKDPEFQQQ